MKFSTIAIIGSIAALTACAPRPETIQPTYTPTALYENLSCEQLVTEARTVSNRAHDAAGREHRHRVEDTVAVTAGVTVFWPALFFVHGADATTAEVAQLRGEMEAIETASNVNNCGIVFDRT